MEENDNIQQPIVEYTEDNVIHYSYIKEFIEELGTKYMDRATRICRRPPRS